MRRILLALVSIFFLQACFFDEPASTETVVLLEDVIYITSNDIRLLGRVFSLEESALDHGFEFSLNEGFSDPSIVSLGEKESVGFFFAEYNLLEENTKYFYRAFVSSGSTKTYSEVDTISTFEAKISSINPVIGQPGEDLVILGTNFPHEMSVFFGDTEAEITEKNGGYRVVVEVPDYTTDIDVPLYVDFDGRRMLADTFEYVSGKWTMVQEFDIGKHFDMVQFKEGNEFIIGFGNEDDFNIKVDSFYTLDLNTLNWTSQEVLTPSATIGSFYTPSGYFGGGSTIVTRISETEVEYELSNAFWKYENDLFEYLGPIPFPSHLAAGFEIGDAVYFAGGYTETAAERSVMYVYEDGSWNTAPQLPFTFDNSLPHINYGDVHLFISESGDMAVFDPSGEVKNIGQFPRSVRTHGTFITTGDSYYIGLFNRGYEFYEFEMNEVDGEYTVTLTPKNDFPGNRNMKTVAAFEHLGDIYFIRSVTGAAVTATPNTEFWRFEPNTLK